MRPTDHCIAREVKQTTTPHLHGAQPRELAGQRKYFYLFTRRFETRYQADHPAVERGFFQQMEESEYIQDKRLIDFYKFLKQLDYQQLISRAPKFVAKLPALTRKNLDQLGRFRKLCNAVGEKHFRDAFHLWTAEAHGLDYFLTMDKAFLNALTQSSRLELPTMPIFPRELVTRMGVSELEPLPIEEGYVYDISGHRQKM